MCALPICRSDLDAHTTKAVAEVVRRRTDEGTREPSDAVKAARPTSKPAEEVARLKKAGRLNSETVGDAILAGQRDFVHHALATMAGASLDYVDRVLQGHSAKGITALAWKAGCSMRVALQLQTNMGGIPPNKALHARDGSDFPLTPKEMRSVVWGRSGSVRVDLGGRRTIKKKKEQRSDMRDVKTTTISTNTSETREI